MSVDIELRKAAAHINAGRLEAARSILSEYLKDFPESDLAWLLMSYVLEDPRLQQASATRALRLNPENEQAKARIDQLLQIQAPSSPEVTSEDFASDFERFYPNQDPLHPSPEQTSSTLSIEDRLAFVTLEAESSRRDYSGDYPVESLLTNEDIKRRRRHDLDSSRRLKPKTVFISVGLVILLVTIAFIMVRFFPGMFISEAAAFETSIVETVAALASEDVGLRLPASWTPTITPTITTTPIPSRTPRITSTPTPINTRVPRPSPTPNINDPAVIAEIENLQQQVSDLRRLSTFVKVNTHMISQVQVRPILENYYFYQVGSEQEISDSSRALVALGLIEPDYDLLTNMLNSITDSVGGFYLHEDNQIYIIGEQFTAVEKFVYVHEYSHALVNLHFDLNRMSVFPRCEGNKDRCGAVRALVEGDATLLRLQWLEQSASESDYDEIMSYQPPTWILPDQAPPPFALRNREFPTNDGTAFVEMLFSNRGWPGVSQAYFQLPESTEQILHPEKYFSGEQPIVVPGVSLETVLGAEWASIESNTLGEWLTYLILGYGANPKAQLNEGDAVRASDGWGGDHYQVYYNAESKETVLVVHWKWDQPSDMNEFASGMRFYLKNRFSEGEVVEAKRECWYGDDQFACLYDDYQQSLWIMAPSMDLVQSIDALYPDFH